MTARRPTRNPLGRVLRMLSAGVALTLQAGCGPASGVDELPLRVNDQLFTLRYALQREPTAVRAVGEAIPSIDTEARLTLALFGVDAAGRIVSRGTAFLRSTFGSRTIPFAIELVPTGRETGFELRVLDYHVPGLRTN
jgi:hypothetical protein